MPLLRRRGRGKTGLDRWVIVGLGNPGDRYALTRHNAGAMVLQELLDRHGLGLKRHKSGCLIAEARIGESAAVIARSATYMNESGRPLRSLLDWYKTPPGRLLVVHDELDVAFGEVRIKIGGGTAGHNGLRSLVTHLGTNEFARVRVGISRPRSYDTTGYVLGEFSASERRDLPGVLARGADAVERVVEVGPERAMNEINTRAR